MGDFHLRVIILLTDLTSTDINKLPPFMLNDSKISEKCQTHASLGPICSHIAWSYTHHGEIETN